MQSVVLEVAVAGQEPVGPTNKVATTHLFLSKHTITGMTILALILALMAVSTFVLLAMQVRD